MIHFFFFFFLKKKVPDNPMSIVLAACTAWSDLP